MRKMLLLLISLSLSLPFGAYAQDPTPADNDFLNAFRYLPALVTQDETFGLTFSYTSQVANDAANGFNFWDASQDDPDLWFGFLDRARYTNVFIYLSQGEAVTQTVGIAPQQIDQVLEATSINYPTFYFGEFDQDAIAAALSADDYELDGVIWGRGEMGTFDIYNWQESANTNLFTSGRPSAARVGILSTGVAVTTNNDRVVEIATLLDSGEAPFESVTDLPDFQALANALANPPIIQATVFTPFSATNDLFFAPIPVELSIEAEDEVILQTGFDTPLDLSDWGELPPSGWVVLFDRQDGDDQVNGIALVYDNQAAAEQAATELTIRLRDFEFIDGIYTDLGVQIDESQIIESNGYFVVVASLRYPYDLTIVDETFNNPRELAFLYNRWQSLIFQREFFLLQSTLQDFELD